MNYEFAPGSVSQSVSVNLRDIATGQGKTGLTYSDVTVSFTRAKANAVAVTAVDLASPAAAWSSGGFKEVHNSLARGEYRFDVPDAALAAGVPWVVVTFKAANVFDRGVLIFLRNPVNNVGSGGVSWPVTIEKADLTPIAGASVWISTDSGGSNVVAGPLTTNAFGQCTFLLDAGGPYYLWVQAEGFNGSNPTAFNVS